MTNGSSEFEEVEIGPFGQASKVWRNRIRQLRFWKVGILFLAFWAIMLATSYLEAHTISTANDLASSACSDDLEALPVCLMGLMLGWGVSVGAHLGMAAAITLVVYAYAYMLKGVTAYLPVFASTIVAIVLAYIGFKWRPVEFLLVDVFAHLYPKSLKDGYVSVVGWAAPIASVLMSLFALFVSGLQAWVVGRIGVGIWRKGDEYKKSSFYKKWSAPTEAYPGVREVFGELFTRSFANSSLGGLLKSQNLESEGSGRSPEGPASGEGYEAHGEAGKRPLSPAQRRKKDRSRRAARAARAARRRRR